MDCPAIFLYAHYMETHRLLVVGATLFAEVLVRILEQQDSVQVVGTSPDLVGVQTLLDSQAVDVLIFTGSLNRNDSSLTGILADNPDLPVICMDFDHNTIQMIVSQRLSIHSADDLLLKIGDLPKRI